LQARLCRDRFNLHFPIFFVPRVVMDSSASDTEWIGRLKAGDPAAARPLWERYFHRLVELAHDRLRGAPCGGADGEDVALSAFASFCRGAREGRFPDLADRGDLWGLLVTIAARKAADLIAHERRLKRGGGKVRGESARGLPEDGGEGFAGVEGHEPTPELAASAAEEFRRLVALLPDEELRQIALAKLEGRTNAEIAGQIRCAIPTVERRLRLIRRLWAEERPA
jgi:DNA-directed RNA polymerase specialized sigma24 family protein